MYKTVRSAADLRNMSSAAGAPLGPSSFPVLASPIFLLPLSCKRPPKNAAHKLFGTCLELYWNGGNNSEQLLAYRAEFAAPSTSSPATSVRCGAVRRPMPHELHPCQVRAMHEKKPVPQFLRKRRNEREHGAAQCLRIGLCVVAGSRITNARSGVDLLAVCSPAHVRHVSHAPGERCGQLPKSKASSRAFARANARP